MSEVMGKIADEFPAVTHRLDAEFIDFRVTYKFSDLCRKVYNCTISKKWDT